jgi:hypothetical protein
MNSLLINFIISATALCSTSSLWGSPINFGPLDLRNLTTISRQQKEDLKTHLQRQIPMIKFTKSRNKGVYEFKQAKFYIQAGLHGNEALTTSFAWWLAARLNNNTSTLLKLPVQELSVDIIPMANPDGARNLSRYNARSVNLNRNFSVLWGESKENPGTSAFSESETRAIRSLFKSNNYDASVDIHGYVNWIVLPSKPKSTNQLSMSSLVYQRWRQSLTGITKKLLPRHVIKTAGSLGDGGAFEDWAFWQMKVPSLCLEMSSPKRFVSDSDGQPSTDQFIKYEAYLSEVFKSSLKLKQRTELVISN